MDTYLATARNFSAETENRIHSDEVAARFGFEGALVPGAAVFGHMTRPLLDAVGIRWLSDWKADVRFLKPAYHGDELTIHHEAQGGKHIVRCHARGLLLAEMMTVQSKSDGSPSAVEPGLPVDERPEIHWDNVEVGQPFPAWTWMPDTIANAEAAAQVEDDLFCYRDGVIHPHAILSTANRAFTRRYRLPAWIHVGSTLRFRRLLRVGDEIGVRTVPQRKWRHKGHEFVELGIAYVVDGAVATEVGHLAIFRIRDSGSVP